HAHKEPAVEGYTLDGKTALVTGVEHPVPRATAAALAEGGAHVAVMTGHGGPEAQAQAREATAAVQQYQRQSHAYVIEVASLNAVRTAIDEVVQEGGQLDILVNGLDMPYARPFLESSDSEWQRLLEHVLYGTLHCVRAAG